MAEGHPAEYPKDAQNPPQEEGMRPGDQPPPRVRVPDEGPDVEEMTTDERRNENPKRRDIMTPAEEGTPAKDAVREASHRNE